MAPGASESPHDPAPQDLGATSPAVRVRYGACGRQRRGPVAGTQDRKPGYDHDPDARGLRRALSLRRDPGGLEPGLVRRRHVRRHLPRPVKSALLAGGISFDRTPSGTIAVPPRRRRLAGVPGGVRSVHIPINGKRALIDAPPGRGRRSPISSASGRSHVDGPATGRHQA